MSKKGVLIGTGIAALGVAANVAVFHMITKSLIEVAITRDGPKNMKKMKSKLKQSPKTQEFQKAINECSERLLAKDIAKVEITSRDGLRLVGHWYPCENAKRVIVAMHGWRSAWHMDFGMIADFWHNEGCSILFAEQRAQNNSEGKYITFGHMERYDCLDWVKWVNKHTESNCPIYLAGISMGASTVLMTAGLELPENVKGVIADCGFTSAYDEWRYVVKDNMKLSYGLRGYMIDRVCKNKLNAGSKNITTISAMQKTQIPILFIHGTDDKFVPVRMTYENYKSCNAPKELLIVPGAIHGQSYYLEKEKYEAVTKKFWEKYQ